MRKPGYLSGLPARWLAACCLVFCVASAPLSATPTVTETSLKSALLLKLVRYVYFPGDQQPEAPLLCVLGETGLTPVLEQLTAALPDERPVQLEQPADATAARHCQLVFIAQSEQRRLTGILRELDGAPVVTLSDMDGFANRGGMVELSWDEHTGNQILLLIHRKNAARQGIQFNAQLLRLATLVD